MIIVCPPTERRRIYGQCSWCFEFYTVRKNGHLRTHSGCDSRSLYRDAGMPGQLAVMCSKHRWEKVS